MDHDPVELGELEREVLELVWQGGEATADALRTALRRNHKESTIRTVLRRLEEKGYLTHTVDGRTYVYRSTQSRNTVAARAAKRIADWFCSGSLEDLLVGIVEEKALETEELDNVAALIQRARKAGR
jgi:BlaI family penicillinase repressor